MSDPKTYLRVSFFPSWGIYIEECSMPQLQGYLSNEGFTHRDLVLWYLHGIELVNPRAKAVIETDPETLDIADKLHEERKNDKNGQVRTRLHGIPFIVKDNMSTKDKMQTTT